MQSTYRFFIASVCILLCILLTETVEAKRFGGGRSLGNAPSTSRSFTSMQPRNIQRQRPAMDQFSRFGGMGGIFTGLLAGTLLGSFFGGGAFARLGLLDILILGGIIFFLYRMFTTRNTEQTQQQYASTVKEHSSMWENLGDITADSSEDESYTTQSTEEGGIENFDVDNFIKGAKILFTRMQESWGNRDIEDIKRFTTKHMFEDIAKELANTPNTEHISVIHLHAELTGTQVLENEECADVLFKATLQEGENEENTICSEIWRFTRARDGASSWKLDGITQV